MEKYCNIAIFVLLGLTLLVRGLIFLESDDSLEIDHSSKDDGIPIVLDNRDDYRDYTPGESVSAAGHKSTESGSQNIDDEVNDKSSEEITLSSLENRNDYRDYTSRNPIIARSHESIKSISLIMRKNTKNKDEGLVLTGFENGSDNRDYPLENIIGTGSHEMVESDPVTEEIPDDIELVYQLNKKRHVPERGLTEETRKLMLDLHNVYRGNVTPPAGNMNILEWDDSLETLAQLWADNCVFAHGRPANTTYYYENKIQPYGQNLYLGTDPSGYKGLWMWYEEYMHYELRNQTCKAGEQCGHYVQMAWAEAKHLGCGIKLCGMRYLIVCHYYPGAVKNMQMFQVGRPCSLCNEENGAFCKDKLCVSHKLCSKKPKICESAICKLRCQNCGRLDKISCKCTCADGWDSPDCSKPCADEHERCGRRPGFPSKATCSMSSNAVGKVYCRKMCDTCVSVTNDTTINHLCCKGQMCQKGYVLDMERKPCRCTLLCPGPLCDFMDDESSTMKNNLISLISQILVLYFINYSNYSF